MTIWLILAAVAVVSAGLKATGPAVLGGRELPERARAVVVLLGPALLASLVVVQTFGAGQRLVLDARGLGLAAAAAALAVRVPPLGAIALAIAVTAVSRALA
jgi:hypothetical protein